MPISVQPTPILAFSRHAACHPSCPEADRRGLRELKDAAGRNFAAGVVLYDGTATIRFGDGLFAVSLRALWEIK